MEAIATVILNSGNIVAIVAFIICYLVIYFQRKSTAEKRNLTEKNFNIQLSEAQEKLNSLKEESEKKIEETQDNMKKSIDELTLQKELMKKDIELLKIDNAGIKEDVKEIKNTLNNIAISIAELAAAAKVNLKNKENKYV